MFELANRLVGIYKTFNCTKCVALSLENVDAAAAASDPTADTPDTDGAAPINNNVTSPAATAKSVTSPPCISSKGQTASGGEGIVGDSF